jgi:SH3 domain-containing protein
MPGRIATLIVTLVLACTAAPTPATPSPARSEPAASASVPAPTGPGAACPAIRQISLGAISGTYWYPSENTPPLVLIAMRPEDPTVFRSLHTSVMRGGALPYTIAAVEPGLYVVLAYGEGSGDLAGAYTPAVACGLRAECTDHSLTRVTVTGGQTVSGIDILDWYAPPGTFPQKPAGTAPLRAGDAVAVCNPYADSANVRASAGLGFPVRRTLENGARVVVRDGPLGADGYDWYEVNLAGDQLASGWVVAYALRK